MNHQRVQVLGIPIDRLSMRETVNLVDKTIQSGRQLHHTVVNAGKIVLMRKDAELHESVVNADLINADGQSIVWLSRVLGKEQRLPERVAGIDLMENLMRLAHERGYKAFFFGAKEEVVKKTVEHYSKIYSPQVVAGYRNGYYKPEEERSIAESIAASGAKILFVAISSPTKENFLHRHRDVLAQVNFTMGVGGSFDVVAGIVKRAPLRWQRCGCEWLYRFLQEPRRLFKRYVVYNLEFALISVPFVLGALIGSHKNQAQPRSS